MNRIMRILFFGTLSLFSLWTVALAQQRTVTGTVTGSPDGLPLPGVTVSVEGTTTKTITNAEGRFSLGIPSGDVSLQFLYTGYTVKVIKVGTSTDIDVILKPTFASVEEVVITSLGIKKKKKEIPYAAQNVPMEALSRARELNVVNSLQGKVAGLDIIKSSSGVGSASRVILRGNRSINGNNQPLYIVDGVPIQNFFWVKELYSSGYTLRNVPGGSPDSENGGLQGGDGIGNMNSEDISSITILKGPNATALYGSRAANGAIVLTTSQGAARKGIGVEFNTNLSMDRALILTRFQHVYGQGYYGLYYPSSEEEWGPKMEGQMVEHWSPDLNWVADGNPAEYAFLPHNNFEDFFQTGYNIANTLSLTSGNDKIKSLFSYTNTNARGIVETNGLKRHNFNLRLNGNLAPRLYFDAKLSYMRQQIHNRMSTGFQHSNPMVAIYLQPSNISLEQAKDLEYFDDAGIRRQHYWNPNTYWGKNIYWMLYRTIRDETRDRLIGMFSLKYKFTDNISLMLCSSLDQIFEDQSYKLYHGTYIIAEYGDLYLDNLRSLENNNDFLVNYRKMFGNGDFSFDISFGGNLMYHKFEVLNTATHRLLKPDLFVITNTSQIISYQGGVEEEIQSLYGFATLGFKNYLFLHLTGRNDWSSTLPKNECSYFYPSVGLNWIITEMVETNPGLLTFGKIRASYAGVGNLTDPYMINSTYNYGLGGSLGYAWRVGTMPNEHLKPENTKSVELGFDVRFFNNRMGLDFTWYNTNTYNQLLEIPLPRPSGYSSRFINTGNVQNRGIEITFDAAPIVAGNFCWDIGLNYAKNENLVIKLSDELTEYTIRGRSWATTIKIVEGGPYYQIFTGGFERNPAGRILIFDRRSRIDGLPITNYTQTIPMGTANPDWIGRILNNFDYKGINLSILIDMRMGGVVYSFTQSNLCSDGSAEVTLEGRDGFVVNGVLESDGISENTIETTAEEYWNAVAGRGAPIGEPFFYDASYVRIREVLLGYTWNLNTSVIQSIGLSLYGRNLGFLYNAAEILDPNVSVGIGNVQGLESFSVPSAMTYGLNARFRF
jgi:TonB-linked SusC/RagA family outer membrane protein